MPHYEFDDGSSKLLSNRHSHSHSHNRSYKLYPTSSSNTNDDSLSFTYSASSSQAGDWSDGSVTDFPDDLTEEMIDVAEMNPSLSSVQQARQVNGGRYTPQPSSIKKSSSSSMSSKNSSKGTHAQTHHQRQGSPVSTATNDPNSNSNSNSNNKCDIQPSTPTTPPPRHSSQKSLNDDAEVWYQSWWMCSFTDSLDSLNLQSNCL